MASRWVSIWFPNLLTDWFTGRRPELKNLPFVLCAPSHGRMLITAANPMASANGVDKGMSLADARAILPSLKNFDDPPGVGDQLLKKMAEWCIRFTPVAAVDAPDGLLLDASGCSHLWGGEADYLTDIIKRFLERGYRIQAAIADTIGAAWAMARYGNSSIVPPAMQPNALISLPPMALRLNNEIIERLYKLGLTQIRDFISMPRSALRRRFGAVLLQRVDQALGTAEEIIQPICPPEPYEERLPCLDPIVRIEGIEIALQRLLNSLCERLCREGKGLRTACFRGYRIDGKIVEVTISTNAPSNHVRHLFRLFEMKLSTIEPALGIELFLLQARQVDDHAPAQEEIWKNAGINDRRLAELIDRLSAKVGTDSIHRFLPDEHYLPERSFRKTLSLTEPLTTAWRAERPRPLQLLPVPERIEVTAPVPDYPPMLFRHRGKLHKIITADGPERIEQEWWIAEGRHRDYYMVEDEAGCRYWLFRSGHYDAEKTYHWYLHGYFA
jgi:protein ImuB